jgi:ribosomal 50S subunit-recycling heat shock protein
MRIDNYISDLGIIKRRTIAKEMADAGHIKLNGGRAKPGHKVKADDIIEITGKRNLKIKVLQIPEGKSVSREKRSEYFEIIEESQPKFDL